VVFSGSKLRRRGELEWSAEADRLPARPQRGYVRLATHRSCCSVVAVAVTLVVAIGEVTAVGYAAHAASFTATASANGQASRVPSWASRGFITYRCGDELCLMRPDGSGNHPLLSSGPSPQWDPAFSDGGRLLAFRGYYGIGDGDYALYVVDTTSCAIHRVTRSTAESPSWSPGAKWVAFEMSGEGIWKVRPDGTRRSDISRGHQDTSPAWSPTGSRILLVRYRQDRGQIWAIRPDGTRATLLHEDERASDEMPAWSHDSTRIAFVVRAGQSRSIKVMNADGSAARMLTKGNVDAWNPIWLPGDRGVAFLAWENGSEGLFVMRPNGTEVHRLATVKTEQFTWVDTQLPRRRC
jgi:Tol biopolymer transport system component